MRLVRVVRNRQAVDPLLPQIGQHRFVGSRDREQIAIFEVDAETGRATHLRLERWGQVQRGARVASESTETE